MHPHERAGPMSASACMCTCSRTAFGAGQEVVWLGRSSPPNAKVWYFEARGGMWVWVWACGMGMGMWHSSCVHSSCRSCPYGSCRSLASGEAWAHGEELGRLLRMPTYRRAAMTEGRSSSRAARALVTLDRRRSTRDRSQESTGRRSDGTRMHADACVHSAARV